MSDTDSWVPFVYFVIFTHCAYFEFWIVIYLIRYTCLILDIPGIDQFKDV